MRILVRNLNMTAHPKEIALLQQLAPDIAILPEYAAPEVIVTKRPEFASTNAQWVLRSHMHMAT
jgi:hypothetical protein